MAEMLDLFDKEGRPAHQTLLRGQMPPEGLYWRVSDAWFVNAQGKLLLQRRALGKASFPGLWSCTGGAVLHGETPREGCIRECREELGLSPDFRRGGLIMGYLSRHSYHDIYLFHQEADLGALRLQREEVMDARWFSPEEARALMRANQLVPLGYTEQLLTMLPILCAERIDHDVENL